MFLLKEYLFMFLETSGAWLKATDPIVHKWFQPWNIICLVLVLVFRNSNYNSIVPLSSYCLEYGGLWWNMAHCIDIILFLNKLTYLGFGAQLKLLKSSLSLEDQYVIILSIFFLILQVFNLISYKCVWSILCIFLF